MQIIDNEKGKDKESLPFLAAILLITYA